MKGVSGGWERGGLGWVGEWRGTNRKICLLPSLGARVRAAMAGLEMAFVAIFAIPLVSSCQYDERLQWILTAMKLFPIHRISK